MRKKSTWNHPANNVLQSAGNDDSLDTSLLGPEMKSLGETHQFLVG